MKTDLIHSFELFSIQPLPQRLKNLKLKFCILSSVLITFIPLVVLSFLEGNAFGRSEQGSLLFDFSLYIRFLISLPLFLLIPSTTGEGIRKVIHHFTDSDLIIKSEERDYQALINQTLFLRDSPKAKGLILIIVLVISFLILTNKNMFFTNTWRTEGEDLTLPGMWFFLVSQPIFHFFILLFLYRSSLWWRFLYKLSRFQLDLTASNADGFGGIGFLAFSIKAFTVPVLAFSTALAATSINITLYEGISVDTLKVILAGLVIFCMTLFIGPLLFFAPRLMKLKKKALYEYSKLSSLQMKQFESKWFKVGDKKDYLASNDFSAAADTMSVVEMVRSMGVVPFNPKSLIPFLLAIIIPFIPVMALRIDWRIILKEMVQIIL